MAGGRTWRRGARGGEKSARRGGRGRGAVAGEQAPATARTAARKRALAEAHRTPVPLQLVVAPPAHPHLAEADQDDGVGADSARLLAQGGDRLVAGREV